MPAYPRPTPLNPWERRDKHRAEERRKVLGYRISRMERELPHEKGRSDKENTFLGKIPKPKLKMIEGLPFALKTILVIIHRAVYADYEVKPGIKSKNKELRDVVLIKKGENGEDYTRYIVVMQDLKQNETIKETHFTTDHNSHLYLPKVFCDYRNLKKTLKFDQYVMCTNGMLQPDRFEEDYKGDVLERIYDVDYPLAFSSFSKRYRVKRGHEYLKKLGTSIKDHLLRSIAKTLVDCVEKDAVLEEDENSYFLKEEVIDVSTGFLSDQFLEGTDVSENVRKLRQYLNECYSTDDTKSPSASTQLTSETLEKLRGKKITLATDFGTTSNEGSGVNEMISHEEVTKFLEDELLIAGNMPDEYTVTKYYIWKISYAHLEAVGKTEKKTIWKNRLKDLIDWLTSGGDLEELTSSGDEDMSLTKIKDMSPKEIKDILIDGRRNATNWFPTEEPVAFLVGWRQLLDEIRELLSHERARYKNRNSTKTIEYQKEMIVLTGTAGIGKSQIVNMYIKRHDYNGNVLWIYADDKNKVERQYTDLTINGMCLYDEEQCKTKSWDDIMKEILEYYDGKEWLLVFDNAEPFILEERDGGGQKYLPDKFLKDEYPHIIITSRKQTWKQGRVIKVPMLTETESREAILRNVHLMLNRRSARDVAGIVSLMGNFPCAVYQAIAYINNRTRIRRNIDLDYNHSFPIFLEEFRKEPEKCFNYRENNLNQKLYSRPIMKRWDNTLESIERDDNGKKAKKLINLLAFIKDDKVPVDAFLELTNKDEEELKSIVDLLKENSIFEVDEENNIIVHKIFKKVMRMKTKIDNRYAEALEETTKLVSSKMNADKNLEPIEFEFDALPKEEESSKSEGQTKQDTSREVSPEERHKPGTSKDEPQPGTSK